VAAVKTRLRARARYGLHRNHRDQRSLHDDGEHQSAPECGEHFGHGHGDGDGHGDHRGTTALRSTPDHGTTLVELLIVLALLSVVVLVAAELVTHSLRLVGAVGRSVRNPLTVQVNERLRSSCGPAAAGWCG
jgi:prepilin-type N-terminal cleavage/methylation domain-containing protein